MENNPAAETREGGTQALSEAMQVKLKEFLPGCRRMLETKSGILIISKRCLDLSSKNSLRTSRPVWNPSLVWIFITWP
jgi:hypothetical protein